MTSGGRNTDFVRVQPSGWMAPVARHHCPSIIFSLSSFSALRKTNNLCLAVQLKDVIRDAQASTIALSTFRKHVRVELPFPVTGKQSAYEVCRAVHELASCYCEGLADHFGADRVYVLFANASVRNCIDRDNEELKSRELKKVRKMRPAIIVVICPRADEAAFIQRLAQAGGSQTPVVIFNALWQKSDFRTKHAAPEVWDSFASAYEDDAAIAYFLEDYILPRSPLESMLSEGARLITLKKYRSSWSVFGEEGEGQHKSVKLVRHMRHRPSAAELAELAQTASPAPLPLLQRFGRLLGRDEGRAPSCPLGYRYDDSSNSCVPL